MCSRWSVVCGAVLLVSSSILATEKQWTGTVSSDWATADNWSPAGVPACGDNLVFGSSALRGCSLDQSRSAASVSIEASFGGKELDLAAYALSVTEDFIVADVQNVLDATDSGCRVELTGTGNLSNPNWFNMFGSLKVAAAGHTTTMIGAVRSTQLEIGGGTIAIGHNGLYAGDAAETGMKTVTADADAVATSSGDGGLKIGVGNGINVTVDGFDASGARMSVHGTGTATLETRALSVQRFDIPSPGTFDANGHDMTVVDELNVGWDANGGTFICGSGTIEVGRFYLEGWGGSTLELEECEFRCSGSFTIDNTASSVLPGTSLTVLTGTSGTQSIALSGESLGEVRFAGYGASYELMDTFACAGDLTASSGSQFDCLGGTTMLVGGDARFTGSASSLMDLDPGVAWFLTVDEALSAEYAEIGCCDASAGSMGQAAPSCIDRGSNVNWNFISDPYPHWAHDKQLGINTAATGGAVPSDVTGFPLLVRLDNTNFVFTQAQASGADMRFSSSTGIPLSYEIEWWDACGQGAAVWVRVNEIHGNSFQQHINMHWGNPAAQSESSPSAVFGPSSGFAGVWHLTEAPDDGVSGHADASGNGNNARPEGSQDSTASTSTTNAGGIAGGADLLGLESGWLLVEDADILDPPDNLTLSAWVKPSSASSDGVIMMGRNYEGAGAPWASYLLQLSKEGEVLKPRFDWSSTSGVTSSTGADQSVSLGQWHHLACVRDAGALRIYLDGEDITYWTMGNPSGQMLNSSWELRIGAENGETGSRKLHGYLDEVTIASEARTESWLKLCHQNQKPGGVVLSHNRIAISSAPREIVVAPNSTTESGVNLRHSPIAGDLVDIHLTYTVLPNDGVLCLDPMPSLHGASPASYAVPLIVNAGNTDTAYGLYTLTLVARIAQTGDADTASLTVKVYDIADNQVAISSVASSPQSVPVSSTVDMKFTARIVPAEGVSTSVIVDQVDHFGDLVQTLGVLLDDGVIPDAAGGDLVFTGSFPVTTGPEGHMFFRTRASTQSGDSAYSAIDSVMVTPLPSGAASLVGDGSEIAEDPQTGATILLSAIVVQFDPDASSSEIEALVTLHNGTLLGSLLDGTYRQVTISAATVSDVYDRIADYEASPIVVNASPVELSSDLFASVPYELDPANPGTGSGDPNPTPGEWYFQDVGIQQAWVVARGSAPISSIGDNGARPENAHPDLPARTAYVDYFPEDTDDGDRNHELGVMSAAAARIDNDDVLVYQNAAGVSWNSPLMSARIARRSEDFVPPRWLIYGDKIAEAIGWSTDQGAKLITVTSTAGDDAPYLRAAIDYAAANEVLVVAASGNPKPGEPTYYPTPGFYPQWYAPTHDNVMAVSVSTKGDNRGKCRYGPYVSIAAPGDYIRVLAGSPGNYTVSDNQWGTSLASPITAGTAALVWEKFPFLSAKNVKRILLESAAPMPDWTNPHEGRLDVFEAVFNGSFEVQPFTNTQLVPYVDLKGQTSYRPWNRPVRYWSRWGIAQDIEKRGSFDPVSRTGRPSARMMRICTPAAGHETSGILQYFAVDATVYNTLPNGELPVSFDINFISQEFTYKYGLYDIVEAYLVDPDGDEHVFHYVSVGGSWFEVNDIGYEADNAPYPALKAGATGWQVFSGNVPLADGPGIYGLGFRVAHSPTYNAAGLSEALIDNVAFRLR